MDSLGDRPRRRSSGSRSSRRRSAGDTVGTLRLANRLLLLTGALLFVNGITITLISALIPVAISSALVITLVTGTVAAGYAATRSGNRLTALRAVIRPLQSTLRSRDRSPRRQGGL
jgi:hypothetical protein